MAEHRTDAQTNVNYANTFKASNKAPVIAKRIWDTKADADAFIKDFSDMAVAGLVLTVINDTEQNNGVYMVQVKDPAVTPSPADNNLKLVRLTDNTNINGVIGDLNVDGYTQAVIDNTTSNEQTVFTVYGIEENDGIISANATVGTSLVIDGVYDETNNKIATESTIGNALESYNTVVGVAIESVTNTVTDMINDMNVNSVMGVVYTAASGDNGARLTFKGISQENGVIGQGIGEDNLQLAKIATDPVADNFTVDYTYSNGVVGTITGQEATTDITARLHGLEELPSYDVIVSSDATDTPKGVKWMDGSTEITGTLEAEDAEVHTMYLVKQNTAAGDTYDEYIVINYDTTPAWERLGSTSADLKGYVKTIKLGSDGQPIYVDPNTTNLTLPIQNVNTATGVANGLAMAYDVKQNAMLSQDITVTGVTVGNVTTGNVFHAGDSITQILMEILIKEIGTKVNANPTVSFTSGKNGVYEVGEQLPNFNLSTTITNYGSYTSQDSTVYTLTKGQKISTGEDVTTTTGILNAACDFSEGPTYTLTNNNASVTNSGASIYAFDVIEGTNVTFNMACKLSSDIKPYTNRGNLGNNISNYVPSASPITISGKYKYFYGCCAWDATGEYSNLFTNQESLNNLTPCAGRATNFGYCNVNAETSVGDNGVMEGVDGKTCLVLILPAKYRKVTSTKDNMSIDIPPEELSNAWKYQNTITYTHDNETTTTYYVYVCQMSSALAYTDIKFSLQS